MQQSLFDALDGLKSRVITKRADFEGLLEGCTALRAITYVASPETLLDLLDKRRFARVELVLGDSLATLSRETLASSGPDIVERLAEFVASGTLTVYIPPRTIHTKLYLLTRDALTRVILTSANLTETAREATRQTNYAWFADLSNEHPWLRTVLSDYDAQKRGSSLFLEDLVTLFRQSPETPHRTLVEAWVSGTAPVGVAPEAAKLLGEISDWALDPARSATEPVYSVRLPDAPAARKHTEKFLTRLGATPAGDSVKIERGSYLAHVERATHLPLMMVDLERREVRLGIGGELRTVTQPVPDALTLSAALERLEVYLDSPDWGEAPDREFAKAAMAEATLYMLASPFANEQMRVMRRRRGMIERRGPQTLYLVGPSSNGKTTFLQFALFLLAERQVTPLPASELTKTKVQEAAALRTRFPLVFDDVNPPQRPAFQDVVKSYWENWWSEDSSAPQLVFSSNKPDLPEWAKSRLKRVDFDVHFARTERNTARLADIFREPNPVFRWFAALYLEKLPMLEEPRDDELYVARFVMRELYRRAGRAMPSFFPDRPLEDLYDRGQMKWRDLIERTKQASLHEDHGRLIVRFTDDLQYYEVNQYLGFLPQAIKWERLGKKVTLDNAAEFRHWLGGETSAPRRWLKKVLGRAP